MHLNPTPPPWFVKLIASVMILEMDMKTITKRLSPGQDLREEIEKLVADNKIEAGALLSIVGSLSKVTLRIAGGKTVKSWEGLYEIVSGTGTISLRGCHIHISAADVDGKTIGGHLKKGCVIKTTAEIVLLSFPDTKYNRLPDKKTGYDELVIK